MNDTQRILYYLSSSELNRCKRNGLNPTSNKIVDEWLVVLKSKWLTKKLKRKLWTLYSLDILHIQRKGFIGVIFVDTAAHSN